MSETDSLFLLNLHRKEASFRAGLCLSAVSSQVLSQLDSNFLHHRERQRWQAFKHAKRADDYLRGRYCSKRATAVLNPDQPAAQIMVDSGVFHQPLLVCPADPQLMVSLSHASQITAAVVFPAAHPMAVDVEDIDPGNAEELRAQLTDSESNMLAGLSTFSELEVITAMWTIKEALSKVLGSGLTAPLSLYEVSTVNAKAGLITAQFCHFLQYKALCFRWGLSMCTLVLPGRSRLAEEAELVRAGQKTSPKV